LLKTLEKRWKTSEKKDGASVAETFAPFFALLRRIRLVWRRKTLRSARKIPVDVGLNVKNVATGAVERVRRGSVADFAGV